MDTSTDPCVNTSATEGGCSSDADPLSDSRAGEEPLSRFQADLAALGALVPQLRAVGWA